MSRAFVKEVESETAELPDRPISPHRNFVTEAGLAAIEAGVSAKLQQRPGLTAKDRLQHSHEVTAAPTGREQARALASY
jgi:hypothetical protein